VFGVGDLQVFHQDGMALIGMAGIRGLVTLALVSSLNPRLNNRGWLLQVLIAQFFIFEAWQLNVEIDAFKQGFVESAGLYAFTLENRSTLSAEIIP